MSCIDPIINKIGAVVKLIKEQELVIFTYGEKNNALQNIIEQNLANVDGIITDR